MVNIPLQRSLPILVPGHPKGPGHSRLWFPQLVVKQNLQLLKGSLE